MEKYIVGTDEDFDGLLASHRYKTDKGEVSLLYPCLATNYYYEIYSVEGNLFVDVERYNTFQEAEKRINELLK